MLMKSVILLKGYLSRSGVLDGPVFKGIAGADKRDLRPD
jgi:hypothetical protein